MNATELASSIKLNPRAIVLSGSIQERMKNSDTGMISGLSPHYATKGIPTVPFEGDEPAPHLHMGASIECALQERPLLPKVAASYGTPLNVVHMIFGTQALAPTQNEYRLLREAGQILKANAGRPIHAACLPVLVSGQYGVAQGRYYLLGLFDEQGHALFINPVAKEAQVLTADFPQAQKVRTTSDQAPQVAQPIQQAPAGPNWYETLSSNIATFSGLKGKKLHEAVMETRAKQLVKDKGLKPKDAATQAQADFEALKNPPVPPHVAPGQANQVAHGAPAQTPAPAAPARRLSQARI